MMMFDPSKSSGEMTFNPYINGPHLPGDVCPLTAVLHEFDLKVSRCYIFFLSATLTNAFNIFTQVQVFFSPFCNIKKHLQH